MQPQVDGFFDPVTFTVSYVVRDPGSKACAIIDPVLDFDAAAGRTFHTSADRILSHIQENGLEVKWILETHVHADHLSAGPYLKHRAGGQIVIGARISIVQAAFAKIFNTGPDFSTSGDQFDRLLNDGETLRFGALALTAMHTPGHTPACMTYIVGDAAFIGDTMFMPDYGTARADFPGGDARALYRSIQKILTLAPATRLFLCHDYLSPQRTEYVWETTVAAQKSGNVHVHDGIDEEAYVKMRTARDATLTMPTLILPSVQINMRAGHFPPAESNGVSYLKLPLNYF
jgi:glyoxylase-like metal-dependent hydrolase (beta-lactamase superfamily II)